MIFCIKKYEIVPGTEINLLNLQSFLFLSLDVRLLCNT